MRSGKLRGGSLEDHWGLGGCLSKWDTKFEKLNENSREVLEEEIVVFGIFDDPRLEGLVRNESHVGGQHHKAFTGLVLILERMLVSATSI